MANRDGGPAFPMPIAANLDGFGTTDEYVGGDGKSGMSLRACLAGQAMAGILSSGDAIDAIENAAAERGMEESEVMAKMACAAADALLAELNKEADDGES